MDPARFAEIERICQAALDQPPERRTEVVANACGGDADLRAEVEALLAGASGARSFLERSGASPSSPLAPSGEAGDGWIDAGPRGPHALGATLGTGEATIRGYQLRERLGAGGFGVVYRAFQPAVDREVAVKVLLPAFANHPAFIRRFQLEAQFVARLEHPHIVPLYDYWREPDGAYLVMRYLRGGSLRDALGKGPLEAGTVQRLVDQVTQALAAAHRQHVIHRDIKPGNVLLDEDGNFYLSDFGIAKDLEHEADLTRTGAITGSPAYISPEQLQRKPPTPQSDLYSLGVLVYEALTGRHPFAGPAAAMIASHLSERVPSLRAVQPTLPDALDEVLRTVTAKAPDQRYPDARSFAAAFRSAFPGTVARRTVSATPSGELLNPYKGLRAFDGADAADFFGREALTRRLIERLGESGAHDGTARFLAVVGPSGSGKSSVVKAGLLPALRRGALSGSERWFIVEMVPGTHPLEELEIALLRVAAGSPANFGEQLRRDERGLLRAARLAVPDGDGELLLVVDQLEELFTGQADRAEAEHLLRSLGAAVSDPRSRVRVVVTLRADFYDRPLAHSGFSRLMQQRTEVVVPLASDELADAIRKPAERAGAALEPGLVETIAADVREQPGALPMLQYALTELFERREGRTLTKAAYEATGRVSGALARRADEVFAQLTGPEQAAARELFLRLVTLGEGTEDTRRRTLHREMKALDVDQRALDAAVQAFGRSRLLFFDRDPASREPTLEVAHEALLREWGRLRAWLDESRADVRMQRLLGAAAWEWVQAQRDPSFLLRGTRLAQFEGWAAASRVALAEDERAYLQTSSAERRAQEAEEKSRHERELAAAQQVADAERRRAEAQAEAARRLERRALGLAGLALVAIVLAVAAFQAQSAARRERDNATRTAAVNHSLVLAADAQKAFTAGDTDLALALASEAVRIDTPPTEAVRALSEVALGPGTRAILRGHHGAVRAAAFSPDGRYAASGGCTHEATSGACTSGELIVWDLASGKELHRYQAHDGWINAIAFTADGQGVLSAGADSAIVMSAVDTGRVVRRLDGHTGPVNALAISTDGKLALSGSDDGLALMWNIESGTVVRRFAGHKGPVTTVSFGPPCAVGNTSCRQVVVSGSADTTIIAWDAATGAVLRSLTGHTDKVSGVALLPDGQRVLSASADLSIRLWDLNTGAAVLTQRFPAVPNCLALSRDGRIAAVNISSVLQLWDVPGWRLAQLLSGHTSPVRATAVSPDQRYVLSGSGDGTLRVWNARGQAEVRRLQSPQKFPVAVASSADGQRLLTGGIGGGALVDTASGSVVRTFAMDYQASPGAAAFSPDGRQVLLGTGGGLMGQPDEGQLALFDLGTGRPVRSYIGHRLSVRSLAWSPDGQSILSGSQARGLAGELILWDAASGREIRRFETERDTTSIAFSKDGRRALTGAASLNGARTPALWDVATGKEIRHFDGQGPVLAVAFGPDDRTALSASVDGSLIQWDVESGAIVRRFTGHSPVLSLAVSADRRFALTGASDGTVVEWDLATGDEVTRLVGHAAPVFSAVFAPDGRSAWSVSADGTIIEWRLGEWSVGQLTDWVRTNRYLRDLTCEERARFRVEPLCGPSPTP